MPPQHVLLQLGSQGTQVTELQKRLMTRHVDVGPVDGIFGPKTLAAVKTFQRTHGLVVDGVVGPKTWGALGVGASSTPATSTPATQPPTTALYKDSAQSLVAKYVSTWSTDEAGLAQALYGRGHDVHTVTAVFKLLEQQYSSDCDDVALEYVHLVKSRGGAPLNMLKKEGTLRTLLCHLLSTGVVFSDETEAVKYLQGLAGTSTAGTTVPASSSPGDKTAEAMVKAALDQDGKKYVYGVEVRASNTDAAAFDCSELVEWAVAQAGGYIPDGSQAQRRWCHDHKTSISVQQAIHTPGALLFNSHHVAISLGNGKTIEAANAKRGVCSLNAVGRDWTDAGLVPGLRYGSRPATTTTATATHSDPQPSTAGGKTASSPASTGGGASAGTVISGYVLYPSEVRARGTLAWRNNNPGNLRNGDFTNAHGAFRGKSNRGFAIFPSHAVGFAALLALLKSSKYRPLTVTKAMERYAPAKDKNDPVAYAHSVSKMTGLDVTKTLGSLSDAEVQKFAEAVQRVEGWVHGITYARNDSRLPAAVRAG